MSFPVTNVHVKDSNKIARSAFYILCSLNKIRTNYCLNHNLRLGKKHGK